MPNIKFNILNTIVFLYCNRIEEYVEKKVEEMSSRRTKQ